MQPHRVISGLAGLFAVLMLTPMLSAVAVAPAPLQRSAASYGQAAFTTSNNQRVQHSRARLAKNACLQRFAVTQAKRMANQERMFHQPLGPIQKACNVGWVGENVAMGYPSGWAVVVKGWMKSPGHRANILSRHYRLMAVAARKSASGYWYASQVFGRKM